MATLLLNFEELLAPLPEGNGAGGPLPVDQQQQLEEDRREVDDPNPELAKRANWPAVLTRSQHLLTTTTKHLNVAARLTEALLRQHLFFGLRDGLQLLRRLVEECWDRLYPPLSEEDALEIRTGHLAWLDSPDRRPFFPTTVRMAPLFGTAQAPLGWLDWQECYQPRAGQKPGVVNRDDFDKAIASAPLARCEAVLEALTTCQDELNGLVALLAERIGAEAPPLTNLRAAVDDCHRVMAEVVRAKRPADSTFAATPAAATAAGATAANGLPADRLALYRQLAETAERLRRLEPHSPVPYLVQKAVQLGGLPFPEMIRRLVRDTGVLAELSRDLGLEAAESPPAPANEASAAP